ncbi:MAG: BolA family transcriptional regulator, partial [Gammaproteobacteria bacterium]|nr:BolA family transcriptional regulator [Gammaproteobacteria bacterium]
MNRSEQIENCLRAALAPQKIEIRDDSRQHAGHEGAKSGGGQFANTNVSSRFQGKNSVQRHQM